MLDILGISFEGAVTIGLKLESPKMGQKDIIKIERREVTPEEVAKIALLSPRASFSIIRDFQVVEKFTPELPEIIVLSLHRAAMQADDEAVRSLLAPVEGEHPELVQALLELVREFRFGDIIALTDRAADGI